MRNKSWRIKWNYLRNKNIKGTLEWKDWKKPTADQIDNTTGRNKPKKYWWTKEDSKYSETEPNKTETSKTKENSTKKSVEKAQRQKKLDAKKTK